MKLVKNDHSSQKAFKEVYSINKKIHKLVCVELTAAKAGGHTTLPKLSTQRHTKTDTCRIHTILLLLQFAAFSGQLLSLIDLVVKQRVCTA